MNYVNGSNAAEVIFGTDLPDIIVGGVGSDALHGGLGKDVFVVDGSDYKEFVMDFEDGKDLVDLRETGISSFSQLIQMFEYDTDILQTSVGAMRLYLNLMDDPNGRVDIDPTDFIFANTPVHTYASVSNTTWISSNVYSVHFGNGGFDVLDLARLGGRPGQAGVTLTMDSDASGTGSFKLNGVTQHFFEYTHVKGTLGDDRITGSAAANNLLGGTGNDSLSGGAGNDVLKGEVGNDLMNGGAGDDWLVGSVGRDVMTGGQGADTFYFFAMDHSVDRVTDFQDGLDSLDIRSWRVGGFDQLDITANADGSLTVAHDATDVSFTLNGSGLTVGDLNGSDFIFV